MGRTRLGNMAAVLVSSCCGAKAVAAPDGCCQSSSNQSPHLAGTCEENDNSEWEG
jgi:hypothetical protein